jgi:hypothetical protein
MKNVFLSAAASGGLNEPLLSTQALERAFSPLQAQASYYYFSSPVSLLSTQACDRAFSPLQAQASYYYFSSPVSLLSTQAFDRAFSPLQAQASYYYFSSPVSSLTYLQLYISLITMSVSIPIRAISH